MFYITKRFSLFLTLFCGTVLNAHNHSYDENNPVEEHHHGDHGIQLASWRWKDYYGIIMFCLIIIMAGIFKLAFHHAPQLTKYFPESCVLIIIGIISGCFIYYGIDSDEYLFPKFTSTLFFHYLLPPIVLDSAYALYDRHFSYNIGSIIVFAVIGTLFNVFAVGLGLYFIKSISKYDKNLAIFHVKRFCNFPSLVLPNYLAILILLDT